MHSLFFTMNDKLLDCILYGVYKITHSIYRMWFVYIFKLAHNLIHLKYFTFCMVFSYCGIITPAPLSTQVLFAFNIAPNLLTHHCHQSLIAYFCLHFIYDFINIVGNMNFLARCFSPIAFRIGLTEYFYGQ